MSSDEVESARLHQLIADWRDGVITPEGKHALEGLLSASRDARDTFLLHSQVDAGLHWEFSAKQKVAEALAPAVHDSNPPKDIIPQAQLGYVNDEGFNHFASLIASNGTHTQLWQQAYPRIRAYVFLCSRTLREAQLLVDRIVEELHERYRKDLPFLDWSFGAARQVVLEYSNSASGGVNKELASQFADACLCVNAGPTDLNIADFNESLEDSVPHLFSADTLRLLYLRYLHGLNLAQIARHLDLPIQQVYALFANVRLLLCNNCSPSPCDLRSGEDYEQLLLVSMFLDGKRLTNGASKALSSWLTASDQNRQMLTKMAVVHEYLDRQLSVCKLLNELEACKDQSMIQAIEASIREIEQFARVPQPTAKVELSAELEPTWRQTIFPIGLAAALLLALGIVAWNANAPVDTGVNETVSDSAVLMPRPDVVADVEAPLPPVVAVVSESFGFPTGSSKHLSVGTPLRMQEAIRFEQGIVQVTTASGSTLVFEGPTDAVMADRDHVLLQHGRMSGLNDVPGRSLIVESPVSRVIDIGTEFGVSVNEQHAMAIAVYDGEVEVEPSTATRGQGMDPSAHRLKAGFEVLVDTAGNIPTNAQPLSHEREFIRADEVELLKEAATGSGEAEAQIGFYGLLRIDGLLAYQGFQAETAGEAFSLGFDTPQVRLVGNASFGPNLRPSSRLGNSGSLVTSKESSCYLDIDTSERSLIAKAGLVDAEGFIGNVTGELWLGWRTKAIGSSGRGFSWAGVSLMFGDERIREEPLFIGKPGGDQNYGIHVQPTTGERQEKKVELDFDPIAQGVQPLAPDFREHQWIVRLRMNGAKTEVGVWCDVAASEVGSTVPQASFVFDDFQFDRIRFESDPMGKKGGWHFDNVVIALTSDSIAEVAEYLGYNLP